MVLTTEADPEGPRMNRYLPGGPAVEDSPGGPEDEDSPVGPDDEGPAEEEDIMRAVLS